MFQPNGMYDVLSSARKCEKKFVWMSGGVLFRERSGAWNHQQWPGHRLGAGSAETYFTDP